MSVLPVWIPPCLDPSAAKHTSRTRPGACDTSLEPSWQKKLIHEKKIPLRVRLRPRCAKTLYSLHKPPKNHCLDT